MEIQAMPNQSIILQGDFLPPLSPVQQLLTSDYETALFASEGPDFEDFREKINASWTAVLEPLQGILLRNNSRVKVAIFISGPALHWLQSHSPKMSSLLQKLNDTQCIQWITGPIDHSLRFLYHRASLKVQFEKMRGLLKKSFDQESKTIAMPGFFYNTYFGYLANQIEAETILVPSKNNTLVSHVPHNPNLKLVHCEPWTITAEDGKDQALVVSLNEKSAEQFPAWLSNKLTKNNWVWPKELYQGANTTEWDAQDSIAQTRHLGRNLEALEHPFCKNWLGHLKELAESGKGSPELHHAGLFEALLGYAQGHKPLQVYRTLLMRRKLAL